MTSQNVTRDYIEGLVHSAIASAKGNHSTPEPPMMLAMPSIDVARETAKVMAAIDTYTQELTIAARIDELDHTEVNTLSSLPGVMTFVTTFGGQSKTKRLEDLHTQLTNLTKKQEE